MYFVPQSFWFSAASLGTIATLIITPVIIVPLSLPILPGYRTIRKRYIVTARIAGDTSRTRITCAWYGLLFFCLPPDGVIGYLDAGNGS